MKLLICLFSVGPRGWQVSSKYARLCGEGKEGVRTLLILPSIQVLSMYTYTPTQQIAPLQKTTIVNLDKNHCVWTNLKLTGVFTPTPNPATLKLLEACFQNKNKRNKIKIK